MFSSWATWWSSWLWPEVIVSATTTAATATATAATTAATTTASTHRRDGGAGANENGLLGTMAANTIATLVAGVPDHAPSPTVPSATIGTMAATVSPAAPNTITHRVTDMAVAMLDNYTSWMSSAAPTTSYAHNQSAGQQHTSTSSSHTHHQHHGQHHGQYHTSTVETTATQAITTTVGTQITSSSANDTGVTGGTLLDTVESARSAIGAVFFDTADFSEDELLFGSSLWDSNSNSSAANGTRSGDDTAAATEVGGLWWTATALHNETMAWDGGGYNVTSTLVPQLVGLDDGVASVGDGGLFGDWLSTSPENLQLMLSVLTACVLGFIILATVIGE